MSTAQEFTLADKQAAVAGVTRLINRHLGDSGRHSGRARRKPVSLKRRLRLLPLR